MLKVFLYLFIAELSSYSLKINRKIEAVFNLNNKFDEVNYHRVFDPLGERL